MNLRWRECEKKKKTTFWDPLRWSVRFVLICEKRKVQWSRLLGKSVFIRTWSGRRSVRLQPSQSCISVVLHSKHLRSENTAVRRVMEPDMKKYAGAGWKKQQGCFHSPHPGFSHKSIRWKLKRTSAFIKNHKRSVLVWTNTDVNTEQESAPKAQLLCPDDLAASANTWPQCRPNVRLKVVSAEKGCKNLKISHNHGQAPWEPQVQCVRFGDI